MQYLNTNTIIYGHNMGTGRQDMFSTLIGYKDYEYFQAHRYILFDTIYQKYGWWEVFAVLEYDTRSNLFPYLQISFGDTDGFMDWIAQARGLSMFDTNTGIDPQSRILTLSTCDRSKHGQYGRLLILAVNINVISYG